MFRPACFVVFLIGKNKAANQSAEIPCRTLDTDRKVLNVVFIK